MSGGHINPESLTRRVAEEVRCRGRVTVDDLTTVFPALTRKQLKKAIQNAKDQKLIALIALGERRGKARGSLAAGTYGPCADWFPPVRPGKKDAFRPPASVWELGGGAQVETWPPAGEGARYQLLGPWVSPEVEV